MCLVLAKQGHSHNWGPEASHPEGDQGALQAKIQVRPSPLLPLRGGPEGVRGRPDLPVA